MSSGKHILISPKFGWQPFQDNYFTLILQKPPRVSVIQVYPYSLSFKSFDLIYSFSHSLDENLTKLMFYCFKVVKNWCKRKFYNFLRLLLYSGLNLNVLVAQFELVILSLFPMFECLYSNWKHCKVSSIIPFRWFYHFFFF